MISLRSISAQLPTCQTIYKESTKICKAAYEASALSTVFGLAVSNNVADMDNFLYQSQFYISTAYILVGLLSIGRISRSGSRFTDPSQKLQLATVCSAFALESAYHGTQGIYDSFVEASNYNGFYDRAFSVENIEQEHARIFSKCLNGIAMSAVGLTVLAYSIQLFARKRVNS